MTTRLVFFQQNISGCIEVSIRFLIALWAFKHCASNIGVKRPTFTARFASVHFNANNNSAACVLSVIVS